MKHKDDFYPFALCPALSGPVSTIISNPNELFERPPPDEQFFIACNERRPLQERPVVPHFPRDASAAHS
jgi:hypothetical protein